MGKLPTGVDLKFQCWRDELALTYYGVQSVLEKRFTCDENGRLPCQKIALIEDLLNVANISRAQVLLTWIDEGPRSLME